MLDLRRLRILREIAVRGSFSAAAQALHLTQPAVSRQIATLEREVGLRLIDRTSRGLRLTDAGRALVERAESLLGQLAAAEAELDAIRGLETGRLRLAAFPTGGATIMLDAIATIRREHPGLEVGFRDAGPLESRRALRAAELDLALVFEPAADPPSAWDGIARVPLLRDVLHVALPPGHPQAAKDSVRLRDLAGDAWIHGTQPGARVIHRACVAAGFEPRLVAESDHAPVIQGLVAAGVGVTLIPRLNLRNVRPGIVVRPSARSRRPARSSPRSSPRSRVRLPWSACSTSSARSPASTTERGVSRRRGRLAAEAPPKAGSAGRKARREN